MKHIAILFFIFISSCSFGQNNLNPYNLQVNVLRLGDRFQIQVSYVVPLDECQAFAFITDYEGSKYIPGIIESKVISREGNRVRVERLIEERIMFFPISMKSTVEYTETSNLELNFEQISGDTKFYKGAWHLTPDKGGTLFQYESQVEPNLLIPKFIIEYFIRNSIKKRFEKMAERANQKKSNQTLACQ